MHIDLKITHGVLFLFFYPSQKDKGDKSGLVCEYIGSMQWCALIFFIPVCVCIFYKAPPVPEFPLMQSSDKADEKQLPS